VGIGRSAVVKMATTEKTPFFKGGLHGSNLKVADGMKAKIHIAHVYICTHSECERKRSPSQRPSNWSLHIYMYMYMYMYVHMYVCVYI
jgi:hypothetical protein